MDALIMAGGKGTRLNLAIEKPLLPILKKPMIDYVIEALLKSNINNIYIAVSKNTSKTEEYLAKKYDDKNIHLIKTLGIDYVHDLNECIVYFSEPFMVLSCDIPTIKSKTINKIINQYHSIKSKITNLESLCVAIEKDAYPGNPSIVLNGYVPLGINILSPKYGEQREELYIIDEPILNINTLEDRNLVENQLLE
jgi:adenosylcobinamide-phosphate guanylyltransferase